MRNIFALLVLLYMIKPDTSNLTVTIDNLKNDSGVVRLAIFDKESAFPDKGEKAYRTSVSKIKNGKATIVFKDVAHGTYAISAFHDANNDGVMNKNAFGIPKEGYGFSNNAMRNFAPPSFSEASFKVDESNNSHRFQFKY